MNDQNMRKIQNISSQ